MKLNLLKRMAPWAGAFPKTEGDLAASFILPLPSGVQGLLDPPRAKQYLQMIRRFMQETFPGNFEIILCPFSSSTEGTRRRALDGDVYHRRPFRWMYQTTDGVGQCIRRGIFQSRGRTILVGSLECYFSPDFYRRALATGADAVRANRRRPESEFVVPPSLLWLIYRRHTWGVCMNWFLKKFLRVGTSDGLSGAYVLRRETALRFFNRIACPGYLYETELDLISRSNGWPWVDLPVTFLLEHEKSKARVFRESVEAAVWLPRFYGAARAGKYEFLRINGNHLTADDWGLSHGINDGILALARLGHLKRISVLADAPSLSYRLPELRRLPGIEWGLHFNLTAPFRPGSKSLTGLIWSWLSRGSVLTPEMAGFIRGELVRQIAALKKRGIRITRFDGHHHIHALPGLLDCVSDILKKEGIRYVRVPSDPNYHGAKTILNRWSSLMVPTVQRSFKSLPFAYPEKDDFHTVNHLVRYLNRIVDREVLIHPAAYDDLSLDAPFDDMRKERVDEYLSLRLLALELRLPLVRSFRNRRPPRAEAPSGASQVPGPFPLVLAAYTLFG
jgi:predicted glycoside hydrolase/deacetylase ChbG (UPF0249 family)